MPELLNQCRREVAVQKGVPLRQTYQETHELMNPWAANKVSH